MRLRTTSIPRSLEAFNSKTASLKDGPSNCLARHRIVVVLPTPGGPAMMIFGTFPCFANTAKRDTVSWLPTISLNSLGRYFSIQGAFFSIFSCPLLSLVDAIFTQFFYSLKKVIDKMGTFSE